MDYCGPRGIPHSEFLGWTPDDQAAALHWMAEDRGRCAGCGTSQWEWEENPQAYEAEVRVCRGCLRRHEASKQHERHAAAMGGVHVGLRRTEVGGGSL